MMAAARAAALKLRHLADLALPDSSAGVGTKGKKSRHTPRADERCHRAVDFAIANQRGALEPGALILLLPGARDPPRPGPRLGGEIETNEIARGVAVGGLDARGRAEPEAAHAGVHPPVR